MVANHAAATLLIGEELASEATAPPLPPRTGTPAGAFRVVHHRFDDSIFIDGGYVIRGY